MSEGQQLASIAAAYGELTNDDLRWHGTVASYTVAAVMEQLGLVTLGELLSLLIQAAD